MPHAHIQCVGGLLGRGQLRGENRADVEDEDEEEGVRVMRIDDEDEVVSS